MTEQKNETARLALFPGDCCFPLSPKVDIATDKNKNDQIEMILMTLRT
jgi:hypothetical protein